VKLKKNDEGSVAGGCLAMLGIFVLVPVMLGWSLSMMHMATYNRLRIEALERQLGASPPPMPKPPEAVKMLWNEGDKAKATP
jgi:hypothetical protein